MASDRTRRLGSLIGSRRTRLRSDVATSSSTFSLHGLPELKKKLDRLSKSVRRDVLRGAGLHALDLIADSARGLAPVGESGRLRASIRVDVGVTKKAASIATSRSYFIISGAQAQGESDTHTRIYMGAGDGSGGAAFYAHFVEYGTIDTPAQPFMRPAVDSTARSALEEISLFLTWEIRKALRGGPAANDNRLARMAA